MKSVIAFSAAALAALAAAQGPDASDLPQCSLPCFVQAIGPTGCQVFDFDCQCKAANQNAIRASVTPCVLTSCQTQQELLQVIQVTYEICQNHGGVVGGVATVSGIPQSDLAALSTAFPQAFGTSAGASASATSSAAASTTASSRASTSSAASVPVYSSASAATSSAVAHTTSAAAHTTPSATSSHPASFTGAAAQVGLGFGAVAAAVALAL